MFAGFILNRCGKQLGFKLSALLASGKKAEREVLTRPHVLLGHQLQQGPKVCHGHQEIRNGALPEHGSVLDRFVSRVTGVEYMHHL